MPAVTIGLWCVAAFLLIGALGVGVGRRSFATPLIYGLSLAVSLVALVLGLGVLLRSAQPSTVILPLGLPGTGAHFRLDALSAFFLFVVNLGAASASLYALGYGRSEPSPLRVLPYYGPFLAGMTLVVLAADAYTFLFAWEFMSLASWALVVSHHRDPANIRAGYIYLVMAGFGTLCLLLAFGLLAGTTGAYAFDAMRASPLPPVIAVFAALLTLVGAGSKAGIVPLHVWLPVAHPAAPSHVSALLSGVMTKVGVYGFVRILFDLIGDQSPWSGLVALSVGGITAVLGVLYALMQHDLKRLLAYHTVENIGIIFIGLGLGLAFRARHGAPGGPRSRHAADRGCVSDRMRFDLRPAATQRLRVRVDDLPGHPGQSAASAMGSEIGGAGGRRAARARGGARRGLFRQGVRRRLPRPSAYARGRGGEGGRPLFARGDVRPCRALRARRHPARFRH